MVGGRGVARLRDARVCEAPPDVGPGDAVALDSLHLLEGDHAVDELGAVGRARSHGVVERSEPVNQLDDGGPGRPVPQLRGEQPRLERLRGYSEVAPARLYVEADADLAERGRAEGDGGPAAEVPRERGLAVAEDVDADRPTAPWLKLRLERKRLAHDARAHKGRLEAWSKREQDGFRPRVVPAGAVRTAGADRYP